MNAYDNWKSGEDNPLLNTIEEYATLINSIGIGVSRHLLDENLTLLWANDCFYQGIGYSKEEYERLFRSIKEYYREYPQDLAVIESVLQRALKKGERQYFTVCRMPVKGGGFRWVRIAGTVTENYQNGCRIIYNTYTDVTDLVRVQEEQHLLQEKLEKSLRQATLAKSDFLTRMSHDIRTPMNAVLGMTQLALESPGNPARTTDCLNKIRLSAETLLSLINDVLDMTKIESGRLTVNRRPFSPERLIRRLTDIFDMQAAPRGIILKTELFPFPTPFYNGDEFKIERILMNLLGNAVKYTGKGGCILLSAGPEYRTDGKEQICFSVKDTGKGIAPGLLARIFEPFEKGETDGENQSGSGLGLSIAQNYARIMGGTIEVESEPGSGSTFTVRLPMEKAEAPAPVIPPKDPAEQQKTSGKRRILLVEDNRINQEIAQCLLEARGFHVDTADNGAEGLARFMDSDVNYYRAVIMDIQMPVMDGLNAAQRIRSLPREDARTTPIIAMSANAFSEDVEKSLAAGMNAHISKPFQIEELMAFLRNV